MGLYTPEKAKKKSRLAESSSHNPHEFFFPDPLTFVTVMIFRALEKWLIYKFARRICLEIESNSNTVTWCNGST